MSITRVCRICGKNKDISKYHKNKKSKGGLDTRCAECKNRLKRERSKTKESLEKERRYRQTDSYRKSQEMSRINNGGYYKLLQRRIDDLDNKYIAGSKYISRDEAIELSLPRYFDGSECKRGHISERFTANRCCYQCVLDKAQTAEVKKKRNEHYLKNKTKIMQKNVENQRKRYASDNNYKASVAARNMLKRVLHLCGGKKRGGSYEILGYSRDQLMSHMSSQFKDGMSWDNYGKWHIDHKKPVSRFIKQGITDPKIINALSNLQPLWAEDNFAKRDSVDESMP